MARDMVRFAWSRTPQVEGFPDTASLDDGRRFRSIAHRSRDRVANGRAFPVVSYRVVVARVESERWLVSWTAGWKAVTAGRRPTSWQKEDPTSAAVPPERRMCLYSGWRMGLTGCIFSVSVVFLLNPILTVWEVKFRPPFGGGGIGTVYISNYQGACQDARMRLR